MRKILCLLMIFALAVPMFSAIAKTGEPDMFFFVESEFRAGNERPMLKKQELSKKQPEVVCPADFYLIEGFAETEGVRAARENAKKGETEILTVLEDGRIQADWIIKDPKLRHVLAAHGDDYYYCRFGENQDKCCEFVRLNKNGDTFVYPHAENHMCFCPPEWRIRHGGVTSDDNAVTTYISSATVSPDGRIAFSFYEQIFDETKDSFSFPYTITPDWIVVIDSDGSVKNIGEGMYPVWLNEDALLFVNAEWELRAYSVKDGTTEAYKTKSGKKITLDYAEYDTQMAVSKDGKHLVYLRSRALGGADACWVSLETGKSKRFKDIIALCIENTPRVFFGK